MNYDQLFGSLYSDFGFSRAGAAIKVKHEEQKIWKRVGVADRAKVEQEKRADKNEHWKKSRRG
jgi:hypothetical protein